jgi:hypothetical protein
MRMAIFSAVGTLMLQARPNTRNSRMNSKRPPGGGVLAGP